MLSRQISKKELLIKTVTFKSPLKTNLTFYNKTCLPEEARLSGGIMELGLQ
jgi:hypothetical protein